MALSVRRFAKRVGIRVLPGKLSPLLRLPWKRNYAKSADAGFSLLHLGLERWMAAHGEVEYATATGNDYAAHEQTYRGFITMVKVGLAVVIAIVILMAIFLT
jgi:hypothetical protein